MRVIILKLTEEEYEHLRTMRRDGWASTIEGKIYDYTYSLTEADAEKPLSSFLNISTDSISL
jgi:hypothetical protein